MADLAIMNVVEATEQLRSMGMRISPETLRDGIEQNQFPFGNLIRRKSGSPVCFIYRKKFEEWVQSHAYTEEVAHND